MTRCTLIPNLWRSATIITYRFCLLVRIKSEKCHWKLYSCFHAFDLCDIYTGMVTGMLHSYKTACSSWFINNGQFPFLLYETRIFPDMTMESTEKRKLSLGTFLWSYGRAFCHIWTIMCKECDTQCVCQGQPNLIFKNLFGMITEWSPTFSPKHANNIAVVFTSLEQFVRRQTVKWSASSLGRHSNNQTCG
jgi:hypothetical protein